MLIENTRKLTATTFRDGPWQGILLAVLFYSMVLGLVLFFCTNIASISTNPGAEFVKPANLWLAALQTGDSAQAYEQFSPQLKTHFESPAAFEVYLARAGMSVKSWQVGEPILHEERVVVPSHLVLEDGKQCRMDLVYTQNAAEWKIDSILVMK
jgi:hypothetical protein